MIKIGVLSDTHVHTFGDLPHRLLLALKGVDLILHAGDLTHLKVLEGLKGIAPQVYAVWGNMDPPDVKGALPDTQLIQIEQFCIGLTHGSGAPFNLLETVKRKFKNKQLNCIVYGHSHCPQNEVHQGILYFNPGSPTDKFFAPYNSCGILRLNKEIKGEIIKI